MKDDRRHLPGLEVEELLAEENCDNMSLRATSRRGRPLGSSCSAR